MINLGQTSKRKIEHLRICAKEDVESSPTGFEDIMLIHNALPEISKDEIDLSTTFLGKRFNAPIMIAPMTGGHPDTKAINAALGGAAEALGIGIGVGSQRAAIEDAKQVDSFRIVREVAPNAFVCANIGAPQLREYEISDVEKAIEMVDADALSIHLNFLQEAIQPEGDVDARGCLDAIKEICRSVNVPVIVKETGAGISKEVATTLKRAGVSAIDVGGLGGTSWAGVEAYRARAEGNTLAEHLGKMFWNWGIPTAISIVESSVDMPIIATGGVRTGIDMTKCLALGASLCGVALPLVAPALKGKKEVIDKLNVMIEELRVAMFLTGCRSIHDAQKAKVVITGMTREILEQRGHSLGRFSR
ncbi:MAG: type 2 isopentenyl-diphosphate Delta-isomerase [Methanocellales archaeon]|nr:type 2 isopentenyl-diphosphate Delta-isomerase [Methanocellales archaeon]